MPAQPRHPAVRLSAARCRPCTAPTAAVGRHDHRQFALRLQRAVLRRHHDGLGSSSAVGGGGPAPETSPASASAPSPWSPHDRDQCRRRQQRLRAGRVARPDRLALHHGHAVARPASRTGSTTRCTCWRAARSAGTAARRPRTSRTTACWSTARSTFTTTSTPPGAIGFRRATEALGTPNVAFAQAPTVVDTMPIEIGLYQQFNNFFYSSSAKATRYWHYDNSVITSPGLPASSRDRFEYGESLRLGYHLNEDLDRLRRARRSTRSATSRRSTRPASSAIRTARTSASARPGRPTRSACSKARSATRRKNFDGGLGSDVGAVLRAEGQLDGLCAADPAADHHAVDQRNRAQQLQELTSRPPSRSTSPTSIHDAWTLAGGLLFSAPTTARSTGAGVNPRTDYFMRGQIGLLYSIRPEIQIGPFFEYSHGSSTDSTLGRSMIVKSIPFD